jgi:hypothetical protein
MDNAGDGVARVDGAGVAVIEDGRHAGDTSTGAVARFEAVAHVAVRAARADDERQVQDTKRWIAGICCAGVTVVDCGRRAGYARAGAVAGLILRDPLRIDIKS